MVRGTLWSHAACADAEGRSLWISLISVPTRNMSGVLVTLWIQGPCRPFHNWDQGEHLRQCQRKHHRLPQFGNQLGLLLDQSD